MTDLVHRDALDAVLADYDYFYDLADQLISETHHGQTSNYTLDLAGQLTDADHSAQADEAYQYDANGNRIGGGYVVGPNNQVLSDGTFSYAYDNEGNLIKKTDIASGEYTEFEFDHRNRLVHGTVKSSGGIILREVSYTYDVFDRLIARTVDSDGAGPQDPVTTYTVYNGDHAWADFDASGTVLARYLFGDAIDEIIARWRPGESTAWYLTDHLGTVRDIANALGQVVNHLDYDSFGQIQAQTNPAFGDRFTFTGREWDPTLSLYYYRARFYDPALGRFVSQDPLGFAAGDANLYRYVANNPLGATDPSGQMAMGEWLMKQLGSIALGAGLESACHLLEAWAQDELDDPWGTFQDGFWDGLVFGIRNALIGGGLAGALGWAEDFLARTSTAVGKVFARLGPLGAMFASAAAPTALVYQVFTEYTGIFQAARRGLETGDFRLLLVRYYCANIRILQMVAQFRMSLPGQTRCCCGTGGRGGVTSALLAGAGLWMQFHHCFPAGTLVSTEAGQRPIETIQEGERVWAFDVQDGQWKLRHVLRTFQHLHQGKLVSLKVAGEIIESTPGYPFWVVSGEDLESRPYPEHVPIQPWQAQIPGRWVDAGDLRVGDVLFLKSSELATIEELTLRNVRETVYNFQVEELESYAVGAIEILVHNNSRSGIRPTNPYRRAGLPTRRGRFRFIPPKGSSPCKPVMGPGHGFMDQFGNEWRQGPPHHFPGDPHEWDVQLRHGGHLDVSIRGVVAK